MCLFIPFFHKTCIEENTDGQFEDAQQVDNLIHRYTVCHSMSSMDKVMTKTLRTVSSLGNIHPCSEAAGRVMSCIPKTFRSGIIVACLVSKNTHLLHE